MRVFARSFNGLTILIGVPIKEFKTVILKKVVLLLVFLSLNLLSFSQTINDTLIYRGASEAPSFIGSKAYSLGNEVSLTLEEKNYFQILFTEPSSYTSK